MQSLLEHTHSKRKRLLNIRPRTEPRRADSELSHNHRFDEATGQVFTETIASIQESSDLDWPHRNVESPHGFYGCVPGFRVARGSRSLRDISKECILRNIFDVTLEAMACLPPPLIHFVWDSVKSRGALSFNTWKLFSKLLNQDNGATLELSRYSQEIRKPKSPLRVYASPLTSASFDFLTSLSITTPFPLPDIVRISSIQNLGALEIINIAGSSFSAHSSAEPSAVSDRLIRTWHQASLDEGAFSVLRTMKLWGHPELTARSLVYLNSFPALAVYDVGVFDSSVLHLQAKLSTECPGWRMTRRPDVQRLLESVCFERVLEMQRKLGTDTETVRKAPTRRLNDDSRLGRIPRSEVPAFLTRLETTSLKKYPEKSFLAEPAIIESQNLEKRIMDFPKSGMDEESTLNTRAAEYWESAIYKTFARIGELRNDTDLSRAGIDIGDQVLADDELVNSIPMASVRLGPLSYNDDLSFLLPKARKRDSSGQVIWTGSQSLAFIRIKLPAKTPETIGLPGLPTTGLEPYDGGRSGKKSNIRGSINISTQNATGKLDRGISKMSKKRKLGDVLSSFT